MQTTKRRISRSSGMGRRSLRGNMKKNATGRILSILVLIVIAALYAYMAYQVNRQDKKMADLQKTVSTNSQTVSGVVNFINSSLANAQNQNK